MANITKVTSSSQCYGCLSRNDEKHLEIYHLKGTLENIFQTNQLILCYICVKLAKNTERFINNVETAQNLFKGITNIANDNVRSVIKVFDLTVSLLDQGDVIQIKGLDEEDEKVKIECDNYFPDIDCIKQEQSNNFKEEPLSSDDNGYIFINGLENEYGVKDDKSLMKLPKLKRTRVKHGKKTKNRRNITQKIKNASELEGKVDAKIETLILTKQQCLEDRAQRRLDNVYRRCEFKCVDCIKGFSYKPSYEKHMAMHSKATGEYECDICKLRVVSEDKLKCHKRCHTVRYRCTECNLTRVCRTTIVDHISNNHSTEQLYRCPKCEKTFKSRSSLRAHLHYTHKEKIPCAICNKLYATKESIKSHMRRRHPTEVSSSKPAKKYLCKECGMAMESASALKQHSVKHSHRRDFYCVECDKSFKTNGRLQQHLKTVSVHVTREEVKHPCPICKKQFLTKGHAERHINAVHLKATSVYCDQCGKEYKDKYKLASHLRQHEGYVKPRKFVCNVCDKGFHIKATLNEHVRIHTGEKPFVCPACPAQFNQYGSLYNHKKLVHKIVGKTRKEGSLQDEKQIRKDMKIDVMK